MFDVLIVGAGSSGCAIAARVSEDANLQVCLVEAGPDYANLADLPFDLVNSHNNSYRAHDWGFDYEPTTNRKNPFPRGRVVGGSSAVNTTIALRGMPEDYDKWADLGNEGWSWKDVLPAFNRLERDLDYGNAEFHGDAGPISIRRYPDNEMLRQHQAFLSRAIDLGYAECDDANDPYSSGAGPQPMNKLGRLRISGAVGYLASARARPNLEIRADTLVHRMLFDGRRCTGVEVCREGGEVQTLSARLVIVCAGALLSPTILMRSGIGAREEIDALGVAQLLNSPGVGKNLSDHPALSIVCEVTDESLIDFDAPMIQTILRYTAQGSDNRNDLQIEQLSFVGRPGAPAQFALAAVLEYQYGRGQLTLSSADPKAMPTVTNRFCEDDRDCKILASGVLDALQFLKTGPLADMVKTIRFPDPAKGHAQQDIEALCRKFSGSGFHPCGTVKMGPAEDPLAVVDARGRVRGLEQLIVADASIMPSVPRANTNLTCFMIGEKVGEWIRESPADFGL